jgi:hypothetical protein
MVALEIPHINQNFIQPPTSSQIPTDLLPCREEIAQPSKLLAACQLSSDDWDPYFLEDILPLQRTWITWRKSYLVEQQRITSSGFYVLCEDPSMFSSILSIDTDNWKDIHAWLDRWGKSCAIITCPLLVHTTPRATVLYGIPNDINLHPFTIIPMFDMTSQFIQQSGYTILSGFTLALAFHRLNIWPTDVFHKAMTMWFSTLQIDEPWVVTTESNAFLFFQHPIPHICDHPLHYAIMGRDKANIKIVKTMKRWIYAFMDDPHIQFQLSHMTYYTTVASSLLPHCTTPYWNLFEKKWRTAQSVFDENTLLTPDLGGFIVSITSSRSRWKWWQANHPRYIHIIMSNFDAILKRIFYLYEYANEYNICHSRLRKLWNQLIESVSIRKISNSIFRILLISCTHARVLENYSDYWKFQVPIAFMIDIRRKYQEQFELHTKYSFNILYHHRHTDIMHDIFGTYKKHECPSPSRNGYQQMGVELHLLQLLRCFPLGTTMYRYSRMLEYQITKALWTLKHGFLHTQNHDENKYYELWMILDTHMRDHITSWC